MTIPQVERGRTSKDRDLPQKCVARGLLGKHAMMRITILAGALAACASPASPLAQVAPQIEIQSHPFATPRMSLSMTTWVHLDVLHEAIDADQIIVSLNGQALTLAPSGTGEFGAGDNYMATFDLSSTVPAATTSTIAISDGETTWSAELENLLTEDLSPTAPLVAGANVFEWPSAASPAPWSTITSACVEVIGASAACQREGVTDAGIVIAQQYITATIAGASGTPIEVTAQRDASAASSGNGPRFLAHVHAIYAGALN